MKHQKKLSVLVPTLNRRKYLEQTLQVLLPQIERNLTDVELVICNNASKDDTEDYIKGLILAHPFIQYHLSEKYVEICDSFSRSILRTTGEYVIIMGDDDIPFPYLIDEILSILNTNPNIGIFHFNRLVGRDDDYSFTKLRVEQKEFHQSIKEYSLNEFLTLYSISAGFISSMVFVRSAWEKGLPFHSSKHYGYEFLGIIYNGIKGMRCVYSDFPLVIQRNPYTRDWFNLFPLIWFIGVPNLMLDLERWGLCERSLQKWNERENKSFIVFCYILFVASSYKKKYRPLCAEINKYQQNIFRKSLTYIIIYLIPAGLYKLFRKFLYKES